MQFDDAFANAAYIPKAEGYPPGWSQAAKDFRIENADKADLGVSYGNSQRQAFDFFRCNGHTKGTLIFVHGGYWLKFNRSYWSHLARGALAQGWDVALVEYDLCPDVSIAQITEQVASAVTKISGLYDRPVSLAGHSAGGHLVLRMLGPGVLSPKTLQMISRVAPISPVTDLRPLLHTSMNEQFKLDIAGAEAESPVLQPAPDVSVKIWVGADERPAFLEQTRALAQAWNVPQVTVPERHHFDVIDALADPESDIVEFLTSR